MKKTILITASALIMAACGSKTESKKEDTTATQQNSSKQIFNLDTAKLKKGQAFYQCEMDLDVLSDQPGSCPKCGMNLTKKEKN